MTDGHHDPGNAGAVAFLDALPPLPVALDLDGVTPHDSAYLQGEGKIPPADWFSPVPIPFLAVARRERFDFPIVPCPGRDPALAAKAARWLCRALESLGAGAKTALDHGRFEIVRVVDFSAGDVSAGDQAEAAVAVGGAAASVDDLADRQQGPQA